MRTIWWLGDLRIVGARIGCSTTGMPDPVAPAVEVLGHEMVFQVQTASLPLSPVRIRIAFSIAEIKILPSPMRPVFAAR